jgi:hypothetical protein
MVIGRRLGRMVLYLALWLGCLYKYRKESESRNERRRSREIIELQNAGSEEKKRLLLANDLV